MSETKEATRRPARGPRVAMAQIAPALGDLEVNLERHRAAVSRAREDGADVLVFPELSLVGYRLKDSVPEVAIRRDGAALAELAALSTDVSLVVGFVEESADHLFFNSLAYLEDGRIVAVHRKTYLPTYGMFDEQRYFARGREVRAFDTRHGRMAMLVCEDMLHPSVVTIAACDGAALLLVASASPSRGVIVTDEERETGGHEADANARSWEAYNRVMARTFGTWVVFCNRVGVEDGVTFWGGSQILTPAGESLVKAAYYDEDHVSAVLSEDAVRRRRIVNPTIRDEDLDLTINELSRLRGRAVEQTAHLRGEREEGGAPVRRREEGRSERGARRASGQEGDPAARARPYQGASRSGGRSGADERGGFKGRFGDRDGERGGFKGRFGDRDGERGGFRGRFGDRDDERGGFRGRFGDRGEGRGGFKGRFGNRDDDRAEARPRPAAHGQGRGGPKPRFEKPGAGRGGVKPRFGARKQDGDGFAPRFGDEDRRGSGSKSRRQEDDVRSARQRKRPERGERAARPVKLPRSDSEES